MNQVETEPRTKVCSQDIELAIASRRLAYYESDFDEIVKKRPAYHTGRIRIHVDDNASVYGHQGIHIFDIPENRKVPGHYETSLLFKYDPKRCISEENLTVLDWGLDSHLKDEILRLAKNIPKSIIAFLNDRLENIL